MQHFKVASLSEIGTAVPCKANIPTVSTLVPSRGSYCPSSLLDTPKSRADSSRAPTAHCSLHTLQVGFKIYYHTFGGGQGA